MNDVTAVYGHFHAEIFFGAEISCKKKMMTQNTRFWIGNIGPGTSLGLYSQSNLRKFLVFYITF